MPLRACVCEESDPPSPEANAPLKLNALPPVLERFDMACLQKGGGRRVGEEMRRKESKGGGQG